MTEPVSNEPSPDLKNLKDKAEYLEKWNDQLRESMANLEEQVLFYRNMVDRHVYEFSTQLDFWEGKNREEKAKVQGLEQKLRSKEEEVQKLKC